MEIIHLGCISEPVKAVTQHSIIDVTKESPVEEELSGVSQKPATDAAIDEEGTKTPVRATRQTIPVERMSSECVATSSLFNCYMFFLLVVHPIVMKSARNPSVDNNKR